MGLLEDSLLFCANWEVFFPVPILFFALLWDVGSNSLLCKLKPIIYLGGGMLNFFWSKKEILLKHSNNLWEYTNMHLKTPETCERLEAACGAWQAGSDWKGLVLTCSSLFSSDRFSHILVPQRRGQGEKSALLSFACAAFYMCNWMLITVQVY